MSHIKKSNDSSAKKAIKEQIVEKLINRYTKNIAITFHVAPDGDAIGSAVALALALEKLDKKVSIITPGHSKMFAPLFKKLTVLKNTRHVYDMTILLDCSQRERTIDWIDELSKYMIVIDHHIDGEKFGNLYLYENKASTSMIIYDILKMMRVTITSEIATALYLGIFGDTSGFSNLNMVANVHHTAAALLGKGVDLKLVNQIYRMKSIDTLKLISKVFAHIVYDKEYRIVYGVLTIDDMKEFNVTYDVTEHLMNELKNVNNADVAFLFIESRNCTRIKARSLEPIHVNEIMKYFNGGGHHYAAGASISSVNIYGVIDSVIEKTKLYIKAKRS